MSRLKEIIREELINEKVFGSQAQYDAYRKKHTLKPGTKVKVAGKTITVRDTKKMSKKAKSLGDRMADKLNKRMADLEKKRKQGKIKEGKLTEVKFKKVILPNDMKTKVKVSKIIKKMKLKIDKDYDVKALKARGGDQELLLLPKHYNKFIELAMQNKLNPRG